MTYLGIAQVMAASAFMTLAMIHFLIWLRAHREVTLLFTLTAPPLEVTPFPWPRCTALTYWRI